MRILLLGDGVGLSTGFAQVLQHVAAALVARGDTVGQIAAMDLPPSCDSRAYHERGVTPFFPDARDPLGRLSFEAALQEIRPEKIFLNMDPGTGYSWLGHLRGHAPGIPTIAYFPLEGAPPAQQFADAMAAATRTVLYTEWAADQMEAFTVRRYPWVWHGVDRDVWHPLLPGDRAATRETLGWSDRFVVAYVSRNAGRKQQPILMEALSLLQEKRPELLLYLHCQPFDNYNLQGWDLNEVAASFGVEDRVEFPSSGSATKGEPGISLARKVACADLVVYPSAVEGFGLPILEAMAAGTPIVIPEDKGNMEEVAGDAPILKIAPSHVSTWFTNARLVHVAPEGVAAAIAYAMDTPRELAAASLRGSRRAAKFNWSHMTDDLLKFIDEAGETPTERCDHKGIGLPGCGICDPLVRKLARA